MTEEKLIYPDFPKELIESQKYLDKYIEFIDSRPIIEKIKFKTAYHHKVPKALNGHRTDKNNLIVLAHKDYFEAHNLLYKSFKGKISKLLDKNEALPKNWKEGTLKRGPRSEEEKLAYRKTMKKNKSLKEWILISPEGVEYKSDRTLKELISTHKLSMIVLKKKLGCLVTSARYKFNENNIGWTLKLIIDS